jgi:hypothetical protein
MNDPKINTRALTAAAAWEREQETRRVSEETRERINRAIRMLVAKGRLEQKYGKRMR